jgi:1,4-alpha-glucan branching enzyme
VGFDDYRALAAEVLLQEAAMLESERVTIERKATGAGAADDRARRSAPTVTAEGVTFTIEAPDAERVQLAGDFNNWTLDGSEMDAVGGVWKKVVKLPPGRYRYRYVVDGRWQNDPLNGAVEPSPYGGNDSILIMDERVAGQA